MTAMRGSESLLDRPAHELEELLLRVARTDAAPAAARESALRNVAAAALGASALSGTAVLGSRGSLLKGTSWLVTKWLAIGAGTGLLGIGVAQGIQELTAKPGTTAAAPRAFAQSKPSAEAAPLAVALAPAVPAPQPETEVVPPKPVFQSAVPAPSAAASASVTEPKGTSRLSSEPSVMAFPPANTKRSLTQELTLLEQTRSALKEHQVSRALQLLDQYRAEFPHSSMESQADALRVEALAEVSASRAQKP
jgi:hypothetical protein